MNTSKKVLLTFIGKPDPFIVTKDGKLDGPVLSLLDQWEKTSELSGINLFHTLKMAAKAEETKKILSEKFPRIEVGIYSIATEDPTDYQALLGGLRQNISALQEKLSEDDEFWIAASPGSPQMQTCWFLLAASREISARLLQVRKTKEAVEGQSPITEIDPQATWFPIIYSPIRDASRESKGISAKNKPDEDAKRAKKSIVDELQIIGSSKSLRKSIDMAVKVAVTASSVIIFGESGTGKESLARLIYKLSSRKGKTFMPVNCGVLTDTLLESELFGHEEGIFTGATKRREGFFKMADGGTLFLDEVGELSPRAQVSLLRVLQEGTFKRLGGTEDIQVDVRVIAATNRDLQTDMKKGIFREDLYYRLMTFPITMSPLRERKQDIALLVKFFLAQYNGRYRDQKTFSKDAVKKLEAYHWPGNIRELKNSIERILRISDEDEIGADEIKFGGFEMRAAQEMNLPEFHEGFNLVDHCSKYKQALIEKALNQSRTQKDAAKLLGYSDGGTLSMRKKRKKRP